MQNLCKITLGQKLKMPKNMLKTFLQHIAVVLCKKRLQKPAKRALPKNAKKKCQKLKTFLQHIAVVLCKKRLQKTANIRKMRAF